MPTLFLPARVPGLAKQRQAPDASPPRRPPVRLGHTRCLCSVPPGTLGSSGWAGRAAKHNGTTTDRLSVEAPCKGALLSLSGDCQPRPISTQLLGATERVWTARGPEPHGAVSCLSLPHSKAELGRFSIRFAEAGLTDCHKPGP